VPRAEGSGGEGVRQMPAPEARDGRPRPVTGTSLPGNGRAAAGGAHATFARLCGSPTPAADADTVYRGALGRAQGAITNSALGAAGVGVVACRT